MTDYQGLVEEFHRAYHLPVADEPNIPDETLRRLRLRLLKEEVKEYQDEETEIMAVSLAKIAKELADVIYVAFGTAATYGIPMDQVFEEVHRSNMSKLGVDGTPIKRGDGKVLKGPNYSPADIETILRRRLK